MEFGSLEETVEDEGDDEGDIEQSVNIHELDSKFFNQKCVICLNRDSDYIFKRCGHQCICEECYRKKR